MGTVRLDLAPAEYCHWASPRVNPKYVGDSYDLVKRFFCEQLRAEGYSVELDGRFTGDWTDGQLTAFRRLLGMDGPATGVPALFVDPDTGIHRRASPSHVSFEDVLDCLDRYALVMVFDQSFSRAASHLSAMTKKLEVFSSRGCTGMYFDSHAPFLFVARDGDRIRTLRERLVRVGLPETRLIFA